MMRICAVMLLASAACFLNASEPLERPVESSAERAALPLTVTIPAAAPDELTPSDGSLRSASYRTWPVSQGDAGSTRYSALHQINRANVAGLTVAWQYHSNDGDRTEWRGIQSNPIIVNGVMYAPTAGRAIVALDAANGRELWRFQVERPVRIGLEDAPARRGLVYWEGSGPHTPRIVFASGKWVYALDAKTGQPLPEFGQSGRTPIPTGGTAVGVIWDNTYIVPGLSGDLYAFDLRDGRELWRFHTIPKTGEFGADTWNGAAKMGANPWGGVCLDVRRAIVYLAVGAPHPNFTGVDRLGDNLFSNCLVALDARTGRRLWHFQNVRHDLWDVDNPAPPNLVTITRDGREIDAVACVTKTGTTLLLDRVTGKPIFPFELRRAPTSPIPSEITAPYQPDPEFPRKFARIEFTRDDITNRSPEARADIEFKLMRARMGWHETYELGRPTVSYGIHGGAEWPGASIDVPTGRMYVAANHVPWITTLIRDDDAPPLKPATAGEQVYQQMCAACHGPERNGTGMAPPLRGLRHSQDDASLTALLHTGKGAMPPFPGIAAEDRRSLLDFLLARDRPRRATRPGQTESIYTTTGYNRLLDHEGYPGSRPPWGTLNCIDLNSGRLEWSVPLGEYEELAQKGLPVTGTENFGGPMVTAGGLVFCAGTRDERIRAFDQDTGRELWSAKLPFGGYAPPATYEIAGRQYIVIAASGGGKLGTRAGDAWVAFALPASK